MPCVLTSTFGTDDAFCFPRLGRRSEGRSGREGAVTSDACGSALDPRDASRSYDAKRECARYSALGAERQEDRNGQTSRV